MLVFQTIFWVQRISVLKLEEKKKPARWKAEYKEPRKFEICQVSKTFY